MDNYIIIPRQNGKRINNDIILRAREISKNTILSFSEAACLAAREILGGKNNAKIC